MRQADLRGRLSSGLRYVLMVLTLAIGSAALGKAGNAETLVIETASGGSVSFEVELARTPEERSVGLMHRDRLDPMAGMLFLYPGPQEVSMWMHSTRIPLDMLFIGADGRIVKVRERAVPYSEEVISSGEPVVAVLEINGGAAARHGIGAGDLVRLPDTTP